MAGHGRTSWDDVAVVTVSILRLVARYEKRMASLLRFLVERWRRLSA